jgi:hypothetical protein
MLKEEVMASEHLKQSDEVKVPRRLFVRDMAIAATVTSLSPALLAGCQAAPTGADSTSIDAMEQALEMMARLAPQSNHGPMAAEALVTLGRPDSVVSFTEAYKKRFNATYPQARSAVTRENWREALGDGNRVADWAAFFNRELKEAAWPQVLDQWSAHLAPGLAAAAAHGLIRTAHAVRSLSVKESDLRLRELAEGLSYWAAYYQPLPEAKNAKKENLSPTQAFNRIPLLPEDKRPRGGSIMIGLRSLDDFSPFANVADLVGGSGSADKLLSEVTEVFATAYVKNVTPRNFIALIHAVTGTTSLRSLMPYLSPSTTQKMLRYGWQTAAALYSVFGLGSTGGVAESKDIKRDYLIERAVASREEHSIKFTEACLREYALNPKPVYLEAARDAVERIRPV